MSRADEQQAMWQIEMSDVPGHVILAMLCQHPDTIDGGIDLATPLRCNKHGRTIWWCLNLAGMWCDAFSSGDDYHWVTATPA